VDCGVTDDEDGSAVHGAASTPAAAGVGTSSAMDDNDEIDLDDEDDDDKEDDDDGVSQQQQEQAPVPVPAAAAAGAVDVAAEKDSDEIDIDEDDGHAQEEEEEEEASPPKNSKSALQARLRKLKMKMNQSRQLNRREVHSEGERLGSSEGAAQHRRQQAKKDRDSRNKEWEAMSARAANSAAAAAAAVDDADMKKLTDQASDVLRKAQRKADRAASNRYGINDYYNSEGQQRNYERSLKSVPRGMTEASSAVTAGSASGAVYDPLTHQLDADTYDASSERAGARRLASELHRRQAKTEARRKRKSVEFDAADVSGINQRNKRFNEKISRNFDAHTAEIRQNLERGTAL
jgi:hypothetical protein